MFEKRSIGVAFEADGTVRAAELISNVRSVILSRVWSIDPEGTDTFESWKLAIERFRESNVDLENAVIGIPDSSVYRKYLSFPFSNRKRVMEILNSELDGEIPLSMEAVVADFIPGQPAGSGLGVTAIACDRDILSWFLELMGPGTRLRGVQTVSVGLITASLRAGMVNGVTIHCGSGEAVLIEFRSSRVRTIKRLAISSDKGVAVERLVEWISQHTEREDQVYLGCKDLAENVKTALRDDMVLDIRSLSDIEVVHEMPGGDSDITWEIPAIGLALSGLGIRGSIPFDLRQGPFKQITPLAGLKGPILKTSTLLLLVGFLGLTNIFTSLNHARGEYQNYKAQLEQEFRELFPGSKPIEWQEPAQARGELDNLRKRVADLSGLEGRGALSILAGLSSAIPEDISLKLDELSYDSRKVRFDGSVSSFDAVDRIKGALDSETLFSEVEVQNARVGADINKVTFRLQMEVR